MTQTSAISGPADPTLFTVTVDGVTFEIRELNDHLIAVRDGIPSLICNVEDDVRALLIAHLRADA